VAGALDLRPDVGRDRGPQDAGVELALSSLCFAGCLRRESRATAIVMAAARMARPMTWPPMSRTSSGRPAERSVTSV
jgi:hypothetical protein